MNNSHKKGITRPFFKLIIPCVFISLLSYLGLSLSAVDISIHDTYYVISAFHVFLISSFICIVQALLLGALRLLKRQIRLPLFLTHLLFCIGFLISLYFTFSATYADPERYFDGDVLVPFWNTAAVVCFIGSWVMTVVNLVTAILWGKVAPQL